MKHQVINFMKYQVVNFMKHQVINFMKHQVINFMKHQVGRGEGVDRHILGFKMAASEMGVEMPALLKTPLLQRMTQFQVSTSQVSIVRHLPVLHFQANPVINQSVNPDAPD